LFESLLTVDAVRSLDTEEFKLLFDNLNIYDFVIRHNDFSFR